MIRNALTKTLMVCGMFVLCATLAGCEESTPTGPNGEIAGSAPEGFQPVPAPGGGDLSPDATSGGGGAARPGN